MKAWVRGIVYLFWIFIVIINLTQNVIAFECPKAPSQVAIDTRRVVEGEMGALKKIIGGGAKVEFEEKVMDVYSKYPNADRLVLSNLMISIFCQQLKESKELSESEKFDLIFKFNSRIMKTSAPPDQKDSFLEEQQISFLQKAFEDKDPNVSRIALGRALESDSAFMQNLALKAMFGGIKNIYSGDLLMQGGKRTPFMIALNSFNEFTGTLEGNFIGWKQEFQGQLTGKTIVIIGEGYTFSATLAKGEKMEGTSWQGCMQTPLSGGCHGYEGVVLKLF